MNLRFDVAELGAGGGGNALESLLVETCVLPGAIRPRPILAHACRDKLIPSRLVITEGVARLRQHQRQFFRIIVVESETIGLIGRQYIFAGVNDGIGKSTSAMDDWHGTVLQTIELV